MKKWRLLLIAWMLFSIPIILDPLLNVIILPAWFKSNAFVVVVVGIAVSLLLIWIQYRIEEKASIPVRPISENDEPTLASINLPDLAVGASFKMQTDYWEASPDIANFCGRDRQSDLLKSWITTQGCRMVSILGLGGIGKTYLAAMVAKETADDFHYIFWRSLRNAPYLHEVLTGIIQVLSKQEEVILPNNAEEQCLRLVHYFRAHRCLLIIDNIESILDSSQTGTFIEGYAAYGKLLNLLGTCEHQSCLLVTGREKAKEIAQLEGETGPVRTLMLDGLSEHETQEMLIRKGLIGSQQDWIELNQQYSGNPLALSIVSEMISEVYGAHIRGFLNEKEVIFGRIQDLVAEQFSRLSSLEIDTLIWLAIERVPTTIDVLHNGFMQLVSKQDLMLAIQSLRRRSLVESSDKGFTLQNVIMEYVTDHFVDAVTNEISSGKLTLIDSHSLLKAQTQEYVRESQLRLIIRPLVEKLTLVYSGNDLVVKRLKKILVAAKKKGVDYRGYTFGNIINLLINLNIDLSELDFSDSLIRQAYLQNVNFHRTNFNGATWKDCVFYESFTSIISIAFSQDSSLFAAGSMSGEIRVWNTSSTQQTLTWKGHTDWVRELVFTPDAKFLLSCSDDQKIKLWDTNTLQMVVLFEGHTSIVRTIAIDIENNLVFSGSDDCTIRIWDMETGECIRTLMGHENRLWSVTYAPKHKILASASEDETIRLWDVEHGRCIKILHSHTGWVMAVAFSPGGELLASGGIDQLIHIWDVDTWNNVFTLEGHMGLIRKIVFSPDGHQLVSSSKDTTIRIWDIGKKSTIQILQGHLSDVWSVAYSKSSEFLVSGSEDRTVRLWSAKDGYCVRILRGYTNAMRAIACKLGASNSEFVAAGENGQIYFWRIGDKHPKEILTGHTAMIYCLAISPDDNHVASGSEDHTIRLWDIQRGQCERVLTGHSNYVLSVAFSQDGQMLGSSSYDYSIRLWNANTGECLGVINEDVPRLFTLAFHPSGKMLASNSSNDDIRIWNTDTRQPMKRLSGHRSWVWGFAFKPTGNILASASEDSTIRLWDVDKEKTIKILMGHRSRVLCVTFNLLGTQIASGGDDQTIRLWDATTTECINVLHGHSGRIWSLKFSSDGKFLVSGSDDQTIRIWDVNRGECVQVLRPDRPYEQMNITNSKGLTPAQELSLVNLGAISFHNTHRG